MRMKISRILAILVALPLVLATAPSAEGKSKVRTRFDEAFDYSKIRTFDFYVHPSKQTKGPRAELLRPRLQALVEELLVQKGFRRSSTGDPDFHVVLDGQISENLDIWGGYRVVVTENVVWESYVPYGGNRAISRGVLIIWMQLPGAEDSFWGGGTYAEFSGSTKLEKLLKIATKATRKILAEFPPE